MNKRFTWSVWLRKYPLAKDGDDSMIADVIPAGKTLKNKDIARLITREGSEFTEETILDILDRCDRIKLRCLAECRSVQTGVVHIQPAIQGSWTASRRFDPRKHKCTITATPTAQTREMLERIDVVAVGLKTNGGACISLVTDVTTGRTDGVVTSGGQIIVDGYKIKIKPADEDGLGLFVEDGSGAVTPIPGPYARNTPKQIVALLPPLADGPYTLYAMTRMSNGATLLDAPRKIVYAIALRIARE
jgi:hypothetical protein